MVVELLGDCTLDRLLVVEPLGDCTLDRLLVVEQLGDCTLDRLSAGCRGMPELGLAHADGCHWALGLVLGSVFLVFVPVVGLSQELPVPQG